MQRTEPQISGYNVMWLMAMFDLPVDDVPARRRYARFRRLLLKSPAVFGVCALLRI
jgi:CRISPR/Cas system-associated protein endoribonuclease Cas2